MKILPFLFVVLLTQTTFAQNSNCKLQIENENWIKNFEEAKSDNDRIDLIKQKIKADSIYSVAMGKILEPDMPSTKTENKNPDGEFCGSRIRFTLHIGKNKSVEANLNSNPKLSIAIDKLDLQSIEKIEYINKKDALTIFGPIAKQGVIGIYIKSKRLKKLIKKTSI